MLERYVHFNSWLKNKFGERVLKICIDGGFTCPNRDGKCGVGGCIFCGERGSGERTTRKAIKDQIETFLNGYKGQRANKFIAYFQNFTNTYDTLINLKDKYDEALENKKIIGLAVATRPDCIDENIAKLLGNYTKNYFVMVELGLQTSNENTAKQINRGYDNQRFTKAVELLKKYDIYIVTHIMVGLPNETKNDVLNTVKFVNNHKVTGVKIHSTYVIKNTKLENMYYKGEYIPTTQEEYVNIVAEVIKCLRKDIVVCRITGDPPKDKLIAPEWQNHKKLVINSINDKLEKENIFQGEITDNL